MLVLSRKEKESIILADGLIEVRIAQIDGDVVKLAIHAPKDISIYRKEVFDSIKSKNEQAVSQVGKHEIPRNLIEAAQSARNLETPVE